MQGNYLIPYIVSPPQRLGFLTSCLSSFTTYLTYSVLLSLLSLNNLLLTVSLTTSSHPSSLPLNATGHNFCSADFGT